MTDTEIKLILLYIQLYKTQYGSLLQRRKLQRIMAGTRRRGITSWIESITVCVHVMHVTLPKTFPTSRYHSY